MTHGKKSNRLTLSSKMILLGAVLALFAFGCAGPKENIALNNAKAAYEKAKGDPNVAANASVPLYEAGRTLKSAEMATSDAETNHLAFMAEKRPPLRCNGGAEACGAERRNLPRKRTRFFSNSENGRRAGHAARPRTPKNRRKLPGSGQEAGAGARRAQSQENRPWICADPGRCSLCNRQGRSHARRPADHRPIAAFLNKYPTRKVSVEGHTDSVGSDDYNLALSQRRAESVRSAIMARGISSDRITAKGFGELYPVASNDTPAGRQQNRRVEILIFPVNRTG